MVLIVTFWALVHITSFGTAATDVRTFALKS